MKRLILLALIVIGCSEGKRPGDLIGPINPVVVLPVGQVSVSQVAGTLKAQISFQPYTNVRLWIDSGTPVLPNGTPYTSPDLVVGNHTVYLVRDTTVEGKTYSSTVINRDFTIVAIGQSYLTPVTGAQFSQISGTTSVVITLSGPRLTLVKYRLDSGPALDWDTNPKTLNLTVGLRSFEFYRDSANFISASYFASFTVASVGGPAVMDSIVFVPGDSSLYLKLKTATITSVDTTRFRFGNAYADPDKGALAMPISLPATIITSSDGLIWKYDYHWARVRAKYSDRYFRKEHVKFSTSQRGITEGNQDGNDWYIIGSVDLATRPATGTFTNNGQAINYMLRMIWP